MSEVEYRKISEERFKQYYQKSSIHKNIRENLDELRFLNVFEPHGFFVDDDLRMVLGETVRDGTIRGGETSFWLGAQGIVAPEHRRKGVVANTAVRALESCVERGLSFVIARETMAGFYERYGVPCVSNRSVWTCDPKALLSAVDKPRGTFLNLTMEEDWERMDEVHQAYTRSHSLSIDRWEEYWEWLGQNTFGTPYRISGWEKDGELRGYVVYDTNNGLSTIEEIDMGYTDMEAYRHLLYLLGNHDSTSDRVVFQGPESGRVFDLVDGGSVECEIVPETILRVVDARQALEDIRYPTDFSGSVVIDVGDQMVPKNDETFELSVEDGTADCTVTESDPDASVDIDTLAQLVVGYRSVSTLEEIADITVHDDRARPLLAELFPAAVSFFRDDF